LAASSRTRSGHSVRTAAISSESQVVVNVLTSRESAGFRSISWRLPTLRSPAGRIIARRALVKNGLSSVSVAAIVRQASW
jgi:hypothetical protein